MVSPGARSLPEAGAGPDEWDAAPQPLLSSESTEWDAIPNLDDFFRRIYKCAARPALGPALRPPCRTGSWRPRRRVGAPYAALVPSAPRVRPLARPCALPVARAASGGRGCYSRTPCRASVLGCMDTVRPRARAALGTAGGGARARGEPHRRSLLRPNPAPARQVLRGEGVPGYPGLARAQPARARLHRGLLGSAAAVRALGRAARALHPGRHVRHQRGAARAPRPPRAAATGRRRAAPVWARGAMRRGVAGAAGWPAHSGLGVAGRAAPSERLPHRSEQLHVEPAFPSAAAAAWKNARTRAGGAGGGRLAATAADRAAGHLLRGKKEKRIMAGRPACQRASGRAERARTGRRRR